MRRPPEKDLAAVLRDGAATAGFRSQAVSEVREMGRDPARARQEKRHPVLANPNGRNGGLVPG